MDTDVKKFLKDTPNMKKRALVIGSGGLWGAYDAGVVFTLCRELGTDHFDAIYGCSSGAYIAAYFALNQPDSGEKEYGEITLTGQNLLGFSTRSTVRIY